MAGKQRQSPPGQCVNVPPSLVLPHERLAERRFALEPLAELQVDLRPWEACDDDRREWTVVEALAAVLDQDVAKVSGPGWATVRP